MSGRAGLDWPLPPDAVPFEPEAAAGAHEHVGSNRAGVIRPGLPRLYERGENREVTVPIAGTAVIAPGLIVPSGPPLSSLGAHANSRDIDIIAFVRPTGGVPGLTAINWVVVLDNHVGLGPGPSPIVLASGTLATVPGLRGNAGTIQRIPLPQGAAQLTMDLVSVGNGAPFQAFVTLGAWIYPLPAADLPIYDVEREG